MYYIFVVDVVEVDSDDVDDDNHIHNMEEEVDDDNHIHNMDKVDFVFDEVLLFKKY